MSRRDRMALDRELMEFARLAGLRAWLSPEECQETLCFRVGRHEVTYHLEPRVRVLCVTSVREPGSQVFTASGKAWTGK